METTYTYNTIMMRSVSTEKTQNRTNGLNLDFVVGYVAEVHHRTIGRL